MAAVAETTDMTRCGIEAGEPCLAGKRCLTHGLWDALGDHIDQFLTSITLQQVVDGSFSHSAKKAGVGIPPPAPQVVFTGGVVTRA